MRCLLFFLLTVGLGSTVSGAPAGNAAAATPPPRVEWKPEYSGGRYYVPVDQIAAYYNLRAPAPWSETVIMVYNGKGDADRIRIELTRGEKRVRLNEWIFHLSFPPIRLKDRMMLSVMDVSNVLDPILNSGSRKEPAILETVVLDPAGGGDDTGIRSPGIDEKTLTLEMAKLLKGYLTQAGFKVVMTRDSDRKVSSGMRVQTANEVQGEAIFLSLRANSSSSAKLSGVETSTFPPAGTPATNETESKDGPIDRRFFAGNISDRESMALATTLQSSVVRGLKAVDTGIRRTRNSELRDVHWPSVLFRLGYLSNREEAARLAAGEYRAKLAFAMTEGVRRYAAYLSRDLPDRLKEDRVRPMQFGPAEFVHPEPAVPLKGEDFTVRIPVAASGDAVVDPGKVEIQVYAFENVNDEEIDISTADPPEVNWQSILPDWKAVKTETLEVRFRRPAFTPAEQKTYGRRSCYGYVARLIYDGRVMDETASPRNLNRALYYFTPVFPRR